ncbi:MAG TPA: hypothetical protein VGF84_19430 [Micromonosporaceae bacterium]
MRTRTDRARRLVESGWERQRAGPRNGPRLTLEVAAAVQRGEFSVVLSPWSGFHDR